MRIAILVEGKTEKAFMPFLRTFLQNYLPGQMPKLDCVPHHGRLPTGDKLKRIVERLLSDNISPADAVIALTDVYTGTQPPEFSDAADAKQKMNTWVGANSAFYPHVEQHDFEAWLLPYWDTITALAGSNRTAPNGQPETVNHNNPPSKRIALAFRTGTKKKCYSKTRDAGRVLQDNGLLVAANACPELKLFLNRILSLCGGVDIP